jgi:hypothetical protein
MSQQNNQFQQIRQMANMLKSNSNPMQLLQSMSQSNPQVSQVFSMLNGSGMTAKNLFMSKANSMGVNPDDIINSIK